jgi:hypothetical protein
MILLIWGVRRPAGSKETYLSRGAIASQGRSSLSYARASLRNTCQRRIVNCHKLYAVHIVVQRMCMIADLIVGVCAPISKSSILRRGIDQALRDVECPREIPDAVKRLLGERQHFRRTATTICKCEQACCSLAGVICREQLVCPFHDCISIARLRHELLKSNLNIWLPRHRYWKRFNAKLTVNRAEALVLRCNIPEGSAPKHESHHHQDDRKRSISAAGNPILWADLNHGNSSLNCDK